MLSSSEQLKDQIEAEIEKDEQGKISVKEAQEILKVRSIDKEYERLKKRAETTQFKFEAKDTKHGLRPYQTEALENLGQLLDEQAGTIAVQLPTGAGKTFLIHAFIDENFKNKNVLIVVPSWEIANQHAATVCKQFSDGEKRVRRLGGRGQLISLFQEYTPKDKGKIILTTAALFFARQKTLREKLKADLVIIDEGHYGWKKKRLNTIRAFARERSISVVLLTATPPLDMETLPFAAQLKYLDLVPEFLVKCEVVRLDTGEVFDPVIKNGVLTQSSRIEISTRQNRFEKIVTDSIQHIKGQTIYYAGSVKEAMGVTAEYEKNGLSSVVVHSKWESKGTKINALAIEKFRAGLAQVLVNVQMLSMGFDVPNVETIIVARPVESDTLFTQMVGRGARPAEGKSKFILIDVHDTISKLEVAKIFEHKHVFYAGAVEDELLEIETLAAPAKIILLPLRPRDAIEVDKAALAYQRSQVIIPYFLERYAAA
ncbi:MAG: DEAD/DEAH box helicase [Bdellovibrionales bacterium]